MAHGYQKAGVVLLLCAPSTLRYAWLKGDAAQIDAELTRLGVTGAAKPEILIALGRCKDTVLETTGIGEIFRFRVWAGDEPHPPDPEAAAIMTAMRLLDGE